MKFVTLKDLPRYVPKPKELLNPFPPPGKGHIVMEGAAADLLAYAFGYIPAVGDLVGQFINDNLMADVQSKMSSTELVEFREQNRVYPNSIALLRTFRKASGRL